MWFLAFLWIVSADALCESPHRCCQIICMNIALSCLNDRRLHCLQTSSLLKLNNAVRGDGYSIDSYFLYSGPHHLTVQFIDVNVVENAYFADYGDLLSLKLYFCGIRSMRLNAFEGQGRLQLLQLTGVDLPTFDFAVLRNVPRQCP